MFSEKNSNLSYVEKANFILSVADISATIVSSHQLKYVTPVIFIKIFQSLYQCVLQKMNLLPKNKEDHIMNVDILLHALKSTSPSSLLSPLTGSLLVSGDQHAIESLVNYFYFLALEIQKKRDAIAVNESHDSSTSQTANHRANISVIKHSHIYISESISIDYRATIHNSSHVDTQLTGGSGPESSSSPLGRTSSNIYYPAAGGAISSRSGSSGGGRSRSNSNASVGRGGPLGDEGNEDEEEEAADQRSVGRKKKKKKKKKSLTKEYSHRGSTTPPRSSSSSRNPSRPSSPTHSRPQFISRTYPPPNHRTSSSSSPASPTSPGAHHYGSSNTLPHAHPPFASAVASTSHPLWSTAPPALSAATAGLPVSQVGDIPCYDLYSGHRITAEELALQRIHRKDKYLALGILLTDNGELRDKVTNEPISLSQIQMIRDKERHLSSGGERDGGDGNHWEPGLTDSQFPGKNTEKSVKKYLKKMKSFRQEAAAMAAADCDPSGFGSVSGGASGAVSASGEPMVLSRTRLFPSYRHLTPRDLVISVEHCHSCQDHHPFPSSHPSSGTLSGPHHDPAEYLEVADEILRYLSHFIHSMAPAIRLGVVRFPTKLSPPEPSGGAASGTGTGSCQQRIGALEVQIGYKKENGEVCAELIYSKLNTNQWPSKSVLMKRLQRLLARYQIPHTTSSSAAASAGGRGGTEEEAEELKPWEEIPLSSEEWRYEIPEVEIRKKQGPFLWCFDSRPMRFQQQSNPQRFQIGTEVCIRHCPNPWGGIEHYSCHGIIQQIVGLREPSVSPSSPKEEIKFRVSIPYFYQDNILVSQSQCTPLPSKVYSISGSSNSSSRRSGSGSHSSIDPLAPPSTFETLNSVPIPLSVVIQFALDSHFLSWSSQSSEDQIHVTSISTDGVTSESSHPHLFLGRRSFVKQIGSLVWECIRRSPGKKSGTMRYNKVMDLSVQLAYSPAVMEFIFATFTSSSSSSSNRPSSSHDSTDGGDLVNILKLMQSIRPKLSEDEVVLLYDYSDQEGEGEGEGDDVIGPIPEGNENEENESPLSPVVGSPHLHVMGQSSESPGKPAGALDSLSYSKNDITFPSVITTGTGITTTTTGTNLSQLNISGISQQSHSPDATPTSDSVPASVGSHPAAKVTRVSSSFSSPRSPKNVNRSESFAFPSDLKLLFSEDSSDS
jgi:hypothetical protein